jgi:predicted DNA-binding transcriptional regulator AlpA
MGELVKPIILLLTKILAVLQERNGREVMDVPQLAAYLGHSQSHIWGLVALNLIPVTRTPGARGGQRGGVRFFKPIIEQWLRDRTTYSAAEVRALNDGRRRRAA